MLDSVEKKATPQRRFKFSKKPQPKNPQVVASIQFEDDAEIEPTLKSVHNTTKIIENESKVFVKDIESSVIVFKNLESITLRKITNSIIFIESNGPAFIFEMKDSIIFVKCHQLRIHDSQNSIIIPMINSNNAIIENCSKLIFKNDFIHVNDFDSPGRPSENFIKSSLTEKDNSLSEFLQMGKLQEILINLQDYIN